MVLWGTLLVGHEEENNFNLNNQDNKNIQECPDLHYVLLPQVLAASFNT